MFSIVIPLFNESKNIEKLIFEIDKVFENYKNYEIILINDFSNDKTLQVIKKLKNNKINILNNDKNLGQSFSITRGVKASKHQIIITLDGDGQNDPIDIPKLLELYLSSNKIKLVGGLRLKRKDSFIKIISSRVANYTRSKILKDDCLDTGCSLKVFDKNAFLEFPYFDGIHRFLPALFKGFGYKTEFIEVNHRKRIYGYSKYGTMNRLFKGVKDIIKVRKILNLKKN